MPLEQRTEMDRWILSRLNSLVAQCDAAFADYEPTVVARAVQDFVVEDLSNWYVRLNRPFLEGEGAPTRPPPSRPCSAAWKWWPSSPRPSPCSTPTACTATCGARACT